MTNSGKVKSFVSQKKKKKVYQQGFFNIINGKMSGKNFPRRLEMKVAKERGKKKTTN